MSKASYFINNNNGNQQAVVLNSDNSTDVWDRDGSNRAHAGGDRFDEYCQNLLNSGYQQDNNPGWQAPSY
jgi:hypothetical protein